jgi:arylsulfatase A
MDWCVGKILDSLTKKGFINNTIIIFSSDNGAVHARTPEAVAKHRPNGILRGQKTEVYEGGTRVPLLVRWDARIPKGSESNELVGLLDWIATFAEFFSVPLPATSAEDSFSFLSTLSPKLHRQTTRRDSLVLDSNRGMMAIRKGKWKLILGRGGGGSTTPKQEWKADEPSVELFDLDNDLGESRNLALQEPTLVETLSRELDDAVQKQRTAPIIGN